MTGYRTDLNDGAFLDHGRLALRGDGPDHRRRSEILVKGETMSKIEYVNFGQAGALKRAVMNSG